MKKTDFIAVVLLLLVAIVSAAWAADPKVGIGETIGMSVVAVLCSTAAGLIVRWRDRL